MTKLEVLRQYFGHKSFREAQESLIDSILSGRDCLGVMPTGAGKSVCFQLPALMLRGTAIVISPLISLMKDQVEDLVQNGISAACINSSISDRDCEEIFRAAYEGRISILYVAPERLGTPRFTSLVNSLEIPLVAVDEAHCVSHWGQDFRPAYLNISGFVRSLPRRPVVAAFTATATERVKRDIVSILALQSPLEVTTGFDRPNLFFDVRQPEDKDEELLNILSKHENGSVIVYCATRKNVASVCHLLCNHGFRAGMYHAGLPAGERRQTQDDFICDRLDVIVATNAFGMGIDKSNVRLVIHYNCPKDLESYYQEAGRAGRDGSPARCVLLYNDSDRRLAEYMIDLSHSEGDMPENERELLKSRDLQRLDAMVRYSRSRGCLRSAILSYFGEAQSQANCGWCSNCVRGYSVTDITVEAQKFLSCIFRLKQHGAALPIEGVCGVLLGECDDEYRGLSTYGIMRGEDKTRLLKIADYLKDEGFFEECGEGRICVLMPKSDEMMRRRLPIRIKSELGGEKSRIASGIPNPELFEQLRALRNKSAVVLGVPPYIVFSDAALIGMCTLLPTTIDEFLKVPGVGLRKTERYGRKFMAEIKRYIESR